ncbi:L-histidine N(alpha)-methyltransferase [Nocardioides plantarum]|uniref:L-histidine N(Alpha)-methyltransferase n=1 Tax=Nocardioides plantarum TaxID=29299 RepID=A0ABV5KFU6_9ACTN|nr:L-histidine N(alpha)-methyltransferase [Nocardioides plantarum]
MSALKVSVLVDSDWASGSLVDDVRRGLGTHPLRLPPKWLYDDEGSRLFDEITRLPGYYPTEAERRILLDHAADIVAASDATTVVELGSGTSDKTRTLLDAFASAGRLQRFVPVDVSEQTLRDAAAMLADRYPGLAVEAVVGDFTLHLGHLPLNQPGQTRLVAFLGGTIGNLYVEERAAFLGALADTLEPGDWLLLGTDLVKPVDRLVAAYHDPGGVTEAFVRNSLAVLNRQLGADFDPGAYSYVPFWDGHLERMDLRLRADSPQHVTIPGADLTLDLAAGEEIQVEISTKFRPTGIRAELDAAGFETVELFTDPAGDFGLTLARLR